MKKMKNNLYWAAIWAIVVGFWFICACFYMYVWYGILIPTFNLPELLAVLPIVALIIVLKRKGES